MISRPEWQKDFQEQTEAASVPTSVTIAADAARPFSVSDVAALSSMLAKVPSVACVEFRKFTFDEVSAQALGTSVVKDRWIERLSFHTKSLDPRSAEGLVASDDSL